ncbi:class I SAM-dependent methyltransferase [Salidesulfovibrio onnuriiensis]|uniref:class I SAM-dependent methyltransferase n=1 Tax=Salidesulfovibrio onnuriiensis TaxID=2583823 RepID=UPI0011C918B9|nr:class I SAM-dependent methyltransferase [Salidesulfovibrio onnuriiensis]
MPTSHPAQLNEIVTMIMMTRPASMLDVGVGFGKYGFLAREYLEIWGEEERYAQREVRIDGIEVFERYLTPVHEYVYDNIYVGDAADLLPRMDNGAYDLLVMCDVLEHFGREQGERVLEECLRVSRNVLVSVPRDVTEQGAAFGNEHERHRSSWTETDFQGEKPSFIYPNQHSIIAYMGDDALRLARMLQG